MDFAANNWITLGFGVKRKQNHANQTEQNMKNIESRKVQQNYPETKQCNILLYECNLSQVTAWGSTLVVRIWRLHKVNPRTVRNKIFLMVVDP